MVRARFLLVLGGWTLACGPPAAPAPSARPATEPSPAPSARAQTLVSPSVTPPPPHGVPSEPGVVSSPTPAPAPSAAPLFADRERVPYPEFLQEMRAVADELAHAVAVRTSYEQLLRDYQLSESDVSATSYSRVRLAFEATRDGGLWGVRWNITDQMPWSDEIWKQWQARDWTAQVPEITAQAECDELSAFFSFLARDLEVQGFVGLFWPTWNHTVAVWQVARPSQHDEVRILVPTSQVWLSREATLGSREFKTNRVVFPYQRQDLKPQSELNAALARYLIGQLRTYGGWSNEQLLERRNRLGGS